MIADAARLVQWGRKWYELAELIARMADRPPLARGAAYTEGQQDGHREEGRRAAERQLHRREMCRALP